MRTFKNNFYQEPETRSFARSNFSRVYSVRTNGVRGGGVAEAPRRPMVFLTIIAVLAVLVLGVLTLTQGAKVSEFDYRISEQETIVSELSEERAELVLENAKKSSLSSVMNTN